MENPGIGCINHVTLEVEKMWLTLLKKNMVCMKILVQELGAD